MLILGMLLICSVTPGQFCALDSVLYAMDPAGVTLHRRTLPAPAIDIASDTYAYVLTHRYLYKIQQSDLSIHDRILLPQRFNHIITDEEDVILIGTNEVILVDKKTLTFKAGIGIEQGDYLPLAVSARGAMSSGKSIYLSAHSGTRSSIKVFDLNTGILVKKSNINTVLHAEYNAGTRTIAILDTTGIITEYDMGLQTLRRITVPSDPLFFMYCESGFLVYGKQGIFLVSRQGSVVDFQPVALTDHRPGQTSMCLVHDGIVAIDGYTMRPKAFRHTDKPFVHLYGLNDEDDRFGLLLDDTSTPFLFDAETRGIQAVSAIPVITEAPRPAPEPAPQDSFWYFQLGAFSSCDNALDAYAALRDRDLPVFIDTSGLYRIKLGGFRDKETAMNALEQTDLAGWFVLQRKVKQRGTAAFFLGGHAFTLKDGLIERSLP